MERTMVLPVDSSKNDVHRDDVIGFCRAVCVCEINDTAGRAKGPEQSTSVLSLLNYIRLYRVGISRSRIYYR